MSLADSVLVFSCLAELALLYSCFEMKKKGTIEFSDIRLADLTRPLRFYSVLFLYWAIVSSLLLYMNIQLP